MSGGFDLSAKRKQPWKTDERLPSGYALGDVHYGPDPAGPGGLGFQVATAQLAAGKPAPTLGDLRALHKLRAGAGTTPTVIAVSNGTMAWIFGPSTEQVRDPLSHGLAQRYLQSVLHEPSTQAAYNRMIGLAKSAETTGIAGVNNSGLFASYHLRENAKLRPDWPTATAEAAPLLPRRGQQLITALGFRSQKAPGGAQILSGHTGGPTAVAILLDESQHFDAASAQFNQLPPVAFGLRIAMEKGIPWLVVLRDDQIRLYPGKDGVGVGQKGQTETFVELDLAALDANYTALLPLIFSASALAPDGTAQQLLDDSGRFASSLGARLRDRIYVEVIPPLAKATAEALAKTGRALDADGLAQAYRVTLRILFRLLFQAYAEDRGLLPSGRNERYDANSLKTAAQRDIDTDPADFSEDGAQLWLDLVQVWNAIDKGNKLWQVPAYNGGLFSSDHGVSEEGGILATITLPDSVIGPVLQHLLVDVSEDGTRGPVDFRSLSVREFGTIYEGLLESSLSVAERDLTDAVVTEKGQAKTIWVPAKPGDTVKAPAGSVYFHSASGERKATGSYFTPKIVVDHLIERSITPALTAHLAKVADLLTKGKDVEAERLFFDFRVVDLAMGSGHFLVAAVDKVEALMRNFLTQHAMPGIQNELLRLAEVAREALSDDEQAKSEVDNVGLLRRQVARRCIYGLDINLMAVELARLAMWIHTFVPGLPMSNLDHSLVCANSLTGIGTVDEALDALQPDRKPGETSLFDSAISDSLESAKLLLLDMANAGEADKAQVAEAAKLLSHAKAAAEPTRCIFDAAIAIRVGHIAKNSIIDPSYIEPYVTSGLLRRTHTELRPAHMPYLFPEVFLRSNPGFDVVLGNPPWEKLKPESSRWWALRFPGLRSLPQAKQDAQVTDYRLRYPDLAKSYDTEVITNEALRRAITKGPFPGIGKGDPDLSLAFTWRNFQLARVGGHVGMLAPRSIISESAGADWREAVFDRGEFADVVVAVNNREWMFPIHPQYSVALLSLVRTDSASKTVHLRGPFYSEADFRTGTRFPPVEFSASEFRTWGTGAAFPLLETSVDGEVFLQLHRQPRLDDTSGIWRARPYAELHASNDKKYMDLSQTGRGNGWPVYKGESFNLWQPDTGLYYGRCDPQTVIDELQRRRQKPASNSPFAEFDPSWWRDPDTLPCLHPRIVLRLVTNKTNNRTVICALAPGKTILQHGAPYLLVPRGDAKDVAFLLGVLSSIPLDWNARRVVEINLTYGPLNSFPVPRPSRDDQMWRRVVEIAGILAAVDDRYAAWAEEVGVPVGSVTDQEEKDDLIAELDGLVSLLYGLSQRQVEHIFATFHRGWDDSRPDYVARLSAVKKHYSTWKAKT